MYTSTSAIIQDNNSIFAYQIYFNLQNRYLNFFYLFHSNIFYLLPSKYTCTLGTSLTRKFSTKFEKRISSSINLKNVSSSTIFRRSWWGEEKNLVTTPITCIVIGIRRLTINLVFASVVDSMHIAWGSIFHHFSSLPSFSFPFLLFVTVFHTRTIYTYIYSPRTPVIKPLSRTKRVTMERWLLEILFVL